MLTAITHLLTLQTYPLIVTLLLLPLAAAAAALPIEEWDSYWPEEIDATDAERDRAAEVWVSLQGFDPASPEAVAARNTLRRVTCPQNPYQSI